MSRRKIKTVLEFTQLNQTVFKIGNQYFSSELPGFVVYRLNHPSEHRQVDQDRLYSLVLLENRVKCVSISTAVAKNRLKRAVRLEQERIEREAQCRFPAPKYDQGMFSLSGLKDKLGWTDSLIKRFLGEPDELAPNPHYKNAGAPMKLYNSNRIAAAESTKEFQIAKRIAETRQGSAEIAVITKTSNITRRVANAKLTIVAGKTEDEIYRLAVETHGGNYAGDPREFRWSRRTAENCIRHNLTNYEALWSIIYRGTTGSDAYALLRERVDALIETTYGELLSKLGG